MATKESLGLLGVESVHWYVHDLERSRRFYTQGMDFKEIGGSDPELTPEAGSRVWSSRPATSPSSSASPRAGVGGRTVARQAPRRRGHADLRGEGVSEPSPPLRRGATIMEDIQKAPTARGDPGLVHHHPFGDSTFRFAQRDGYRPLYPGMIFHEKAGGGRNRFGFNRVDHVTSNFRTLMPAILWMEQVMGLERFWKIEFHTEDAAEKLEKGSGLRSTVMWDPESGVKFANNEPARPNFKASQINIFVEDNRGEGIQHLALGVENIIPAVEGMKQTGSINFMDTPDSYYDQLGKRLEVFGIKRIDEKPEDSAGCGSSSMATRSTATCSGSSEGRRHPLRRPRVGPVLLRGHPAQG
jgi:4-hydroxyphenylpyruvate dioxygenase